MEGGQNESEGLKISKESNCLVETSFTAAITICDKTSQRNSNKLVESELDGERRHGKIDQPQTNTEARFSHLAIHTTTDETLDKVNEAARGRVSAIASTRHQRAEINPRIGT